MNKIFIFIALLFGELVFIVADVNAENSLTSSPNKVSLHHKDNRSDKTNRCPAMPIFGTFDGYVLSLEVVAEDAAETYELVINTESNQTVGQYTALELNQGIAVPSFQSATIELTTPSGFVYVGEL